MSEQHEPDPEFVEYLKNEVNNPFLSAATVLRMEQTFIHQREKYEAMMQATRAQDAQLVPDYVADALSFYAMCSHMTDPVEDGQRALDAIRRLTSECKAPPQPMEDKS